MNEAMLLAKVQHKNLVNLYGYCARGNDKLLVYEYVCNESLDKILFSSKQNSQVIFHQSLSFITIISMVCLLTYRSRITS